MGQYEEKARALVAQMTREEKASLCSGADFWHIPGVERLGLAPVCLTDGPHGLRKEQKKETDSPVILQGSVPATCFPAACATACSFDPALLEEMGAAMGEECIAENVAILLGPGVNIKRSPLCGRNFEYFSEDPLLAGKCAAGMIRGVESKNVGTSLKHYAANNQEYMRLVGNSVVDERALREIYLAGFETAVKEGKPATVMCSYNRINGTYACENKKLLTDILRTEWGFDGIVVSDWGATNRRVDALAAGLDLEMPGPDPGADKLIADAVCDGRLEESVLDEAAVRLVCVLLRGAENTPTPYDADAHHALCAKIAEESAVLLKNDGALPLDKSARLLVTGGFAKTPRYQGAGSSQIQPTKLTSMLDAMDAAGYAYAYAEGFAPEQAEPDEQKLDEAVRLAADCDVICVCAGLPASFESEGYDRKHLDLPESQLRLISAMHGTGKPVVVTLSNGSSVLLPFAEDVNAILLLGLTGQNGGTAAVRLLYGDANPCGKLAETYPLNEKDCLAASNFGVRNPEYRESIYVGYRGYDKAELDVRYPFGHGLSYTSFAYSGLTLSEKRFAAGKTLNVSFTVTNTGAQAGKEIAQVYVCTPEHELFMPVRELRAFTKIALAPGESQTVTLPLTERAFSYYNVPEARWDIRAGEYTVAVGASSRDLPLSATVTVEGAPAALPDLHQSAAAYYTPGASAFTAEAFEAVLGYKLAAEAPATPFTRNTPLCDLAATRWGRVILRMVRGQLAKSIKQGEGGVGGANTQTVADNNAMMEHMLMEMPVRGLAMLGGGMFTPEKIDAAVDFVNGHVLRGARGFLKKG